MTASTTARKSTPAKATAEKPENVETPEVVETQEKPRIPEALSNNSILAEFCRQYLAVFDEISEYNKEVLAERDAEWNAGKVLEKARELGRPADANTPANQDIKNALEAWEKLVNETARARKSVLDTTSKVLGITLSATSERNPETEAPLKEKRKIAFEIGTQLSNIAKMTTDENASAAVVEFLANSPLPAVGRDQTRNFGDNEKATPKYRVNVTVSKDGNKLIDEAGFTKAALALTKYYERGKSPKADKLRGMWESAGNSPEKTVTSPVEFQDNGLHYVITKK